MKNELIADLGRATLASIWFAALLFVLFSVVPYSHAQSGPVPGGNGGGDNGGGGGGGGGGDMPNGDTPAASPDEFRSIDGTGNNLVVPGMGAAETELRRAMPSDYRDGVSSLAGQTRPSAREVSNVVCDQYMSYANEAGASDYIWQWGQFLDHDIDLTEGADPAEAADITVPAGDVWFDPSGTGTAVIALNRSIWEVGTGTSPANPRQQANGITAWIDASNVYGSDEVRAAALRTNDGTGRLATGDGDLLPFNTAGLPNAGGTSATLFLAGDVRANEQVGLAAMHTLFVREHNRLAERIRRRNRRMSGDEIYEQARRMVGAEIQAITFREFLPVLLGPGAIPAYRGYDDRVDARIANSFSTASYRYGHSQLSETILRLDRDGLEIPEGNLALRDAFFAPHRLTTEGGIEPVLRGLANQVAQAVDAYVIDDVRNMLFGEPGSGGFDLVSLNIQRGRDHGLPSYNDARQAYGLPRAQSFADISSSAEIRGRFEVAYGDVDDVDLWVGGLAEDHVPGALVGELVREIVSEQFTALRDGDRFWYEAQLERRDRRQVERMTLARVLKMNARIKRRSIGKDPFRIGR